ncbi:MAG: hypothetical protein IPQ07_40160 [Myxococcales bacterium]|nr:hypothetical protein [Myxococcales bacterium]
MTKTVAAITAIMSAMSARCCGPLGPEVRLLTTRYPAQRSSMRAERSDIPRVAWPAVANAIEASCFSCIVSSVISSLLDFDSHVVLADSPTQRFEDSNENAT